jgi:hypothetical protein
MRRLSSISLAILLSACIPIPTGSGSRTRVVSSTLILVKQIRARLAKVREEIPARRAQLHPVRCGSQECYETEEVSAAIVRIRKDVQAAFLRDASGTVTSPSMNPQDGLASRISLDEEIVEAAAVIAAESQPSIQLIRNAPEAFPSTIDRRNVETIFRRISERIDHYLAHRELNPTIRMNCNVIDATFEMQVGDNAGTRVEALTNHELPSVWRGHYRSRAHKTSYRDSNDPIDLFNNPRTKVRCKLVGIHADVTEESHCWLED